MLRESERAALACTRGVIVPAGDRTHARGEFGVPAERITIATVRSRRAAAKATGAVALLAVGAIVPRKATTC